MPKDNILEKRAYGPFFDSKEIPRLSIDDIRPYLLNSDLTDDQMARLIKDISLKFTKVREKIGDYVLEPDYVSAYAALYLTTNIPKLYFLFSQLPLDILSDLKNRTLIDIGCGPGTFSLGWLLFFEQAPPEIICVDSSSEMLCQAEKILKGFFSQIKLKTQKKYLEQNQGGVLFYGHSINEMGNGRVMDQIMMVDPEYVIWIEPGTSELFYELKKLREALLDRYDVLYPCPSNSGCPNHWCHQVLRMSHDPSVEKLSQLASLDRKIMPMTAHVYRKKRIGLNDINEATIIRFINETKFSFEYEVCLYENSQNRNRVIEIQKKQLSKQLEKHFKNLSVGEKISFEVDKIIGEKIRVKLKML